MIKAIIVCLTSAAGGFAQTVSGFGSGIIMMMIFPAFYSLNASPAISNAICTPATLALAVKFHKEVDIKKLLLPGLMYLAASSFAIAVSSYVNMNRFKLGFGLLLALLAVYSLSLGGKLRLKGGIVSAALCGTFSGLMSGFFSIGGPFMVLYFLSVTHSKEEYLGSINCFMAVTTTYQLIYRIFAGVTTAALLPPILVGILGMSAGFVLGVKVVDKIDGERLIKIVNIFLLLSGLLTMAECLIS